MNNDLANFTVEFTTKGFKELRDDMKELGEKMDDLSKKMSSVKTHGGWLDDFIGGLEGKIKALAVAIGGLGIKKAFDVKDEVLNLEQLSVLSGVAEKNIEALGLALKFSGVQGGDINTAGDFYRNLQDFREKLARGNISDEQAKEWGISKLKLNPAASLGEYIWDISSALYNLNSAGETGKMDLLAKSLGILNDPMEAFLLKGPEVVQDWLKKAGAEAWRYDPKVKERSKELNENWEIFKNRFNKMFSDEWLNATKDLVKVLNKIEPSMAKLVNHLGGVFGDDIRTIAEIVGVMNGEQTLGQLVDKLKENHDMAESMGEVIGMALGAIIGALIGHPVLGALIGRQVGGNIANLIWKGNNKPDAPKLDMTEEDWNVWAKFGAGQVITKEQYDRLKSRLPSNMMIGDFKETEWFAGMSADLYGKQIGVMKGSPNITTNIKLDPTKPVDMTQNPDGTWTTRDGRGMTMVSGVM